MYSIEQSLEFFQEELKKYLELNEKYFVANKGVCQETGRLCGLFDFGIQNAAKLIQLKLSLLAQKKVLGLTDEEVRTFAMEMGYPREPIIIHRIDCELKFEGMEECLF